MKTCETCSKRLTRRCEEWKQNGRYTAKDGDGWCAGWRKGKADVSLARIGKLVDRINKQTAIINGRHA